MIVRLCFIGSRVVSRLVKAEIIVGVGFEGRSNGTG